MKTTCVPAGPPSTPVVGSLFAYDRDPIGFLMKLARDYGDIARFRLASEDVYFINHPGYIEQVLTAPEGTFVKGRAMQRAKSLLGEGLLTSEGETHHRWRQLANPSFTRRRIVAEYARTMIDHTVDLMGTWTDRSTVDIEQEMTRLTIRLIAKALFGVEVRDGDAEAISASLTDSLMFLKKTMLPLGRWLEHVPLPAAVRAGKSRRRLDTIIQRMIDDRRRHGGDGGDLLGRFLAATEKLAGGGGGPRPDDP